MNDDQDVSCDSMAGCAGIMISLVYTLIAVIIAIAVFT
jgi:hypothetical protein